MHLAALNNHVPLAAAWVDVRGSAELARSGQVDQALQLAQEAVKFAPGSPKVQLQLADVLAMQQQWQQASNHYLLAMQTSCSNGRICREKNWAPINLGWRTFCDICGSYFSKHDVSPGRIGTGSRLRAPRAFVDECRLKKHWLSDGSKQI